MPAVTREIKVCHLTSVHPRNDIRIFAKQCRSLAGYGYRTSLVVADGLPDETREGVRIYGCAKERDRLHRVLNTPRNVLLKAQQLDADIYQLHDPELMPVGLKLKRLGKKVIFDSHEDVCRQMLTKPYLNRNLLRLMSVSFSFYQRYACSRFDGLFAATPFIRDTLLATNPNTLDINNFPLPGELDAAVPWSDKRDEVCYIGGIAALRGIREVIAACGMLESGTRLNLAGRFSEAAVEAEVREMKGWQRVNQLGFVDRKAVRETLGRSVAGLVTFHPVPNHVDAQPNKMFEYMSAGIPVIASHFPLWKEIVEGNGCGLCVDPLDPAAIAGAIDFLIKNPDMARWMGENGRKAVTERYNWLSEEQKLFRFYEGLQS
jgi:glycosyltransferase involved in cell wall biosynthesis